MLLEEMWTHTCVTFFRGLCCAQGLDQDIISEDLGFDPQ
jgi:hypothetical protein